MNQITVLIVGAGPVGLTLACELARRKVPFRIVERLAEPPRGSRAKALQPRSLEVFNDLGIAEELMKMGWTDLPFRKFNGSQLIGDSPRSVFAREDTRYPKTLLLPQWKVEDSLRGKLGELGGTIEWSTELTDVSHTDGGVMCRLERAGFVEEVACRYMVACDGGKSSTRKKLGINFVGETRQQEQLWVGDVEVEGLTPDAWYNWLGSKFGIAFALFPFKDTRIWQLQAVMLPDEEGNVPTPTLEGFNELFKERTQMEGVRFTNSTWQSIYRVNIRRAERYRVGNAFIAGDAGHVHSIAGGMGMNTGIQDAYNLGWKLAAVVHGQAGDGLLDTYGEERIPIADWLLAATSERQKAMMAAAATGKAGFETLATQDTTQLNLNYRDSSLSVGGADVELRAGELSAGAGLRAGDRAPDVRLVGGGWLSDRLKGPEWKLLVFGGVSADVDEGVNVVQVGDEAIVKAYGVDRGVVLIRPDGYVALVGDSVRDYFKGL
ncbi:MAG: FAD-dependent monooxygenase [Bacteroidetes bacterium]|nr:FAD-dependent monooxygenase [Bacteroidota bacterium]